MRGGPEAALAPRLVVSDAGRVEELERFSHYVARQIGFNHVNECPHLCTLAYDYLRKNKGYEENIFAFFQNSMDSKSLIVKFIEELDRCILGYFSFHWKYATYIITQVLTVEGAPKRKLRSMVLEATRKQRFERVTRNLKVTRLFSTLVEELKAIGPYCHDETPQSDVMVPAAHSDRSPVLLLMGGGMGAGKSTVLKDILKEAFWSGAAANAVVVEADAFKETDVIYRAISSRGHHNDMLQTAELVHQSSMDAASSLLVTALNEGRDVIMDGTLSWVPFVQQTIDMARAVHRQRYRMGVGYKVTEDGTITEEYWEPVEDSSTDEEGETRVRKPYRIELVGVVCDAYLAVIRGIRKWWKISARTCIQTKYTKRWHWQESCDLRESSEGEVPAEVPQAICHRVPQILWSCRQREALQHQLHGCCKVDRMEGRREQPAGGSRRDRLPGKGERLERRGQLRRRALPRRLGGGMAGPDHAAVEGAGAAGAQGRGPEERGTLPNRTVTH